MTRPIVGVASFWAICLPALIAMNTSSEGMKLIPKAVSRCAPR